MIAQRRTIILLPLYSVLQAEMSGMNLSYECRRGNCTSCAAKVREGEWTMPSLLTFFLLKKNRKKTKVGALPINNLV